MHSSRDSRDRGHAYIQCPGGGFQFNLVSRNLSMSTGKHGICTAGRGAPSDGKGTGKSSFILDKLDKRYEKTHPPCIDQHYHLARIDVLLASQPASVDH